MSNDLWINIGGRPYRKAELRPDSGAISVEAADLGANGARALEFCRRWLGAQERFVVRTSGSTGDPKPIELRRTQLVQSALATGRALNLRSGQHALVCLPVRYIAGRMMLVRGFVLGLNMTVIEPAGDPFAAVPQEQFPFDFMAVVPLQMQKLLAGPAIYRTRLNAMSAILIGGGPVSFALHTQIETLSAPVYQTFGMTETATHFALRRLNGPEASEAYTPLPGVHLGRDERGCLNVRSPVTLGVTLQTNDLVELRADGSFVWLGRWDHVINSGGVKVHPEAVEQALERALYELGFKKRRFFVAGLPHEHLGEEVTALFEGPPFPADVESQLVQILAERLSAYEAPRKFLYRDHFSETPTGKTDRLATLGHFQ